MGGRPRGGTSQPTARTTASLADVPAEQGSEYAAYLRTELDREHARRETVDSRAGIALTGAAGLLTLGLAAVAVVKGQNYRVHGVETAWLFVAVALLLLAAVLAVLAGVNWKYQVLTADAMGSMLNEHWTDTETTARSITAQANLRSLASLRVGTNIKSRFLLCAFVTQTAAIAALAVDLAEIFTSSS